MPKKCFLDIVTKYFFPSQQEVFILSQEKKYCAKKKVLAARRTYLSLDVSRKYFLGITKHLYECNANTI